MNFTFTKDGAARVVQVDATGAPVPVPPAPATPPSVGTITGVVALASPAVLLAANPNRKGAAVFNESTATLYLALSATPASPAVYTVQVTPGGYFELPPLASGVYTGQLGGIWSAANGNARVTEWT